MSPHKPQLSVNKVNTIMKSSSDVDVVSKESAILMSKATELFLKNLTQEGLALTKKEENKKFKLDYKHLAEVVHTNQRYDFLRDIMPKKITVLEFKKIMAKKKSSENNESSSEDDSSSSENSDNDSSSE